MSSSAIRLPSFLVAFAFALAFGWCCRADSIDPPAFDYYDSFSNSLTPTPLILSGDVSYPTVAPTPDYLFVEAQITDTTKNETTTETFEFHVPVDQPLTVTIGDPANDNLTLSSVGYILSDTLIPLDQLNLPLDSVQGSPISLPNSSAIDTFTVTPLPRPAWGLALLLAAMFIFQFRQCLARSAA